MLLKWSSVAYLAAAFLIGSKAALSPRLAVGRVPPAV